MTHLSFDSRRLAQATRATRCGMSLGSVSGLSWTAENLIAVALARGVGAGYQQDCQKVENEHQGEEGFGAGIGAGEFFPDEDAP